MKTAAQARAELKERGQSITDFALSLRVGPQVVHDLLSGKTQGLNGRSRKVAIALGMHKSQRKGGAL